MADNKIEAELSLRTEKALLTAKEFGRELNKQFHIGYKKGKANDND